MPNTITYPKKTKEDKKIIKGVTIQTFLVPYDEVKDFGMEAF